MSSPNATCACAVAWTPRSRARSRRCARPSPTRWPPSWRSPTARPGYARLAGIEGIRVDAPEQVGPAWDRALAADGPVLIDAVTDPEVPPLPPHIRFEQAKGMTKAILHGDPAAARDIRHSLRGKLAELVTRS